MTEPVTEPEFKPGPYLRLLLLVALVGIVSAVITFVFMALVSVTIPLIWQQDGLSGIDGRLLTIVICTVGGLLVGLLVRIFGDHNAIFSELMLEFARTGRFDYRNAPGILITSFVSLVSGASLGPEAPLADTCGGIGTLLSDRLKLGENETRAMGYGGFSGMLGAFVTSPFGGALLTLETAQGGASAGPAYLWGLVPSLVASAAATIVFVQLSGRFFETLYAFPEYAPRLRDLVLAVPFSFAGGLAGVLFMLLLAWFRRLMQPLGRHLVLRGLIGGLGMGIIGALLPLTLFSGETGTLDLIQQAAQIGFWMLILLAIGKLLATSLLLATGWKGGYVFPIMFAGVALGMAGQALFPGVPAAVTVAAALAGGLAAAMRAPLFAAIFTLAMVQPETAPVVAISVLVGSLMTTIVVRRIQRRAVTEAPPEVEQP